MAASQVLLDQVPVQRETESDGFNVDLICDVPVTGAIDNPQESDFYILNVAEGERVEISVVRGTPSGPNFQPAWRVLKADGTPASSCGSYGTGLLFDCGPLSAAGNPYRIEVADSGLNDIGTYRVHIYRLPAAVACENTQLTCNVSLTSTIDNPLDRDFFSLNVAEGERVEIGVVRGTPSGPNFQPAWRVLKADGTPASSCGGYGTGPLFDCGPLSAAGNPYRIEVADSGLNDTGAYGVRINFLTTGCPAAPMISLTPASQTIVAGTGGTLTTNISATQSTATTVTLTSSNPDVASVPASVVIPANTTSAPFEVMGRAPGTATITATLPASLGGGTATANVTVTAPRIMRVVCASSAPGSTLTVPVELFSQGDENALGFSLAFDPAILSNPLAMRGRDAGQALFNTNTSEVMQGRFGIALALPSNTTFNAGTRQVAVVTFTVAANTTAATTTIDFSDAPIRRQVSNVNAQALPANYQSCSTIAITRGYEADVTPRPNGKNDGTIAITDWVQVGRFAAGLDTAAAGSEFQRADCAPREAKGDGQLAIVDWVQAGRYAAGLDPVQTAGGPTAAAFAIAPAEQGDEAIDRAETEAAQTRTLRAANATFQHGQTNTLVVELGAQGDENALGFSLNYDPNLITFVSATVGDGSRDALLIVNTNQTASGRVGIALALPAGQRFAAGTRAIATVLFNVVSGVSATTTSISFGDQPIRRQVSDVNAVTLPANYSDSTVTLARVVANVSAASFDGTMLTVESIVAAFGTNLATVTEVAASLPLPTTLAGTTVKVKDSTGIERPAPLFFVAPSQVNYQVPPNTALGNATVTVTISDGTVSTGTARISSVAPGLFAANANGQGVAAAVALRVKADGSQSFEPVTRFDQAQNRFVAVPIDLGPESDQVFLILFGTGIRFYSTLSTVTVKVGGTDMPVQFAGAAPGLVGLDQVNARLLRSLIGRGEVDVALMVDGKAANTVKVSIR